MEIVRFALKVRFYKKDEMIYFSQIDLFHILERALRRTDLELYYTKGFNPHVKISFSNGLKLGVEGCIEATLYFSKQTTLQELKEKLNSQLPAGLEIL